ncbi:MAG: hypothetical protein ACD_63C00148G0008 [uncultured bacterium]|nr:MAG: hypothetical protein ACD_63C00148G0008 [uncultured bacterium]
MLIFEFLMWDSVLFCNRGLHHGRKIMSRSKRYLEEKRQIADEVYRPKEAIELLKKISKVKFDPSVEVHCRLNVDSSQGSQMVRGTVVLPAGCGKTKRVAVFCTHEKEKEAKEAGADIVGGENLVKEIKQNGKLDFDVAVAEPAMMKFLGRIAPILGPRGLMPNPKTETVTSDIGGTVKALKSGKVDFRMDDGGNIHQLVGKLSFDADKLVENIETFIDAVKKVKPAKVKGDFLGKVVVTSTMGPAIKIKV